MDRVHALRAAGLPWRAARVERCSPPHARCRDRLCETCGRCWVRKTSASLFADAAKLKMRAVLFATLKTGDRSLRGAIARHRTAWCRFRDRTRWPMLGALHMTPTVPDGWLVHAHVLVFADDDERALGAAIENHWRAAGGNRPAWSEPTRDPKAALSYALWGAITPPDAPEHATTWITESRGVRLVIRARTRSTTKRKKTPATPHAAPHLAAARITTRVLRLLRRGPMSRSDLRRRFSSRDREAFAVVMADLIHAGKIVPEHGPRAVRWAAVEGHDCGTLPRQPGAIG